MNERTSDLSGNSIFRKSGPKTLRRGYFALSLGTLILFALYAILATALFFLSDVYRAGLVQDDGRHSTVKIVLFLIVPVVTGAALVVSIIRSAPGRVMQKADARFCFRLNLCFFAVILLAALPYMLIVLQNVVKERYPFWVFVYLIVFFLPLLCVVLAIGARFSNAIATPVIELDHAMKKVSEGDYSVQIPARYNGGPGNFARSFNTFNTMVQNLERSQAALVRAGNMSVWQNLAQQLAHEIKNPLTPIKLSAERILRRYQNDPEHLPEIFEASVGVIIREVDNLTALLDEFRILSRPIEIRNAATSLTAVLDECVSIFSTTYPGIRFSTDAVDRTLTVSIGEQHLRQVLNNLIINAIDAMNTQGSVEVSALPVTTDEGPFAKISVIDSGEGIDDEAKDKIFTPYWTSKPTGTGLGLPIVEHIVRDYGGNISFDSAKGVGTTFVMLLPRKN
jgi:nitrogen fixation/metabolism regulation signal transduction histidine kinase